MKGALQLEFACTYKQDTKKHHGKICTVFLNVLYFYD